MGKAKNYPRLFLHAMFILGVLALIPHLFAMQVGYENTEHTGFWTQVFPEDWVEYN